MTTKVKVPVAEIEEFATWLSSNPNDLKDYIDTQVSSTTSNVPNPVDPTDDGKVATAQGGAVVWQTPTGGGLVAITSDVTYDIGDPGDFPTLMDMMEFLQTRYIAPNVIVRANILEDITETKPFVWAHPQSSQIYVEVLSTKKTLTATVPVTIPNTARRINLDSYSSVCGFYVPSGNTLCLRRAGATANDNSLGFSLDLSPVNNLPVMLYVCGEVVTSGESTTARGFTVVREEANIADESKAVFLLVDGGRFGNVYTHTSTSTSFASLVLDTAASSALTNVQVNQGQFLALLRGNTTSLTPFSRWDFYVNSSNFRLESSDPRRVAIVAHRSEVYVNETIETASVEKSLHIPYYFIECRLHLNLGSLTGTESFIAHPSQPGNVAFFVSSNSEGTIFINGSDIDISSVPSGTIKSIFKLIQSRIMFHFTSTGSTFKGNSATNHTAYEVLNGSTCTIGWQTGISPTSLTNIKKTNATSTWTLNGIYLGY